ncbi:unnamed protein product [Dovyalis caffra]|uniref:J domain-containing protein n=1 Tax=Dovyalis caffra TaxID=77055 RepID=A0AAV1RFA4_9ROSI|nr:unnamed protein product [Dovyalis caffra]
MDGNKDEAIRCVKIAKEAIASGNKGRALKFIKMAQRLNHNLCVNDLLSACERLDSAENLASVDEKSVDDDPKDMNMKRNGNGFVKNVDDGLSGERIFTEEHVQLIRQINRNKDYYGILGVEKSCSVEVIRKAYRKLSLKVHPDKNKAPGSEEAFKKVCKAFKCLSDGDSRKQYDQTGLVDEFEHNQQYNNVRRQRTSARGSYYDDAFDPDEIFRAFFGQADVFRTRHVYRNRGMGEPEYSLLKNLAYQIPKSTEKYGVEYFVKSSAFDENFPPGSPARDNIEDSVIKDYRNMLWRYCNIEIRRRQWSRNMPTPNCDKLRNLGLA